MLFLILFTGIYFTALITFLTHVMHRDGRYWTSWFERETWTAVVTEARR